jgi:uncharacterized protein (UPF0332 family)
MFSPWGSARSSLPGRRRAVARLPPDVLHQLVSGRVVLLQVRAFEREEVVLAEVRLGELGEILLVVRPYLFEHKEAPTRIVDLLAKAGDRLEAAANVQTSGQGDPADVVCLSYEAMFSCVRALVYAKGYREFGLRCLLLACENLYVPTGQLDAEHLRKFELAQRLKMPPAEAVEASSSLVKRTLELLGI